MKRTKVSSRSVLAPTRLSYVSERRWSSGSRLRTDSTVKMHSGRGSSSLQEGQHYILDKTVSALRKLLPIIVPPLMEVIRRRASSHQSTHKSELRKFLNYGVISNERWTAWLSILSFLAGGDDISKRIGVCRTGRPASVMHAGALNDNRTVNLVPCAFLLSTIIVPP